ncbi:MAG TPA: aminoglycoside phosphotransferase family protein [Pyrinomonadaceae bacterium]|nr:aminoglycoside phosphotransferase family protein [Pyrinomonadaceae bacterium]
MPAITPSTNLLDRIQQHAREWRLTVEDSFETETSIICFVNRAGQSLVLKLVKKEGDEWNAGAILTAFDGHGVVRVYERTGGAMLLERVQPATSLADVALEGRDEEATEILASVIATMSPHEAPDGCPTIEDWGKGFERYLFSNDRQISGHQVESAAQVFADLCASQSRPRLLHGDLHHYNILSDAERGWLAIDPKGVIGELEYEIGAMLRNPYQCPELFLSLPVIERRLKQLTSQLSLNYERTLRWAFAQAVLSATWNVEDGSTVEATQASLRLAGILENMLA